MSRNEIVMIGDIVKSRKKFDPKKWEGFHDAIKAINRTFGTSLKIPFTIYSGDSFGAVIKDIESAVAITLKFPEIIHPYQFRMVLIEDEINFGLDNKNFLDLEGPALWKSESILTELTGNPYLFKADIKDEFLGTIINSTLNLILSIKQEWNGQQMNIYKAFLTNKRQEDIATEFQISQQYVSKIIKSSKFRLIQESDNRLLNILNTYHENRNL